MLETEEDEPVAEALDAGEAAVVPDVLSEVGGVVPDVLAEEPAAVPDVLAGELVEGVDGADALSAGFSLISRVHYTTLSFASL